jgi:hypothetical protein
MKWLISIVLALLVTGPASRGADKSLNDKVLDLTLQHIKSSGPDEDAAQLVSMMHDAAWARRDEFVRLVTPFLDDKDPAKVAGAIKVLYRFRHYRPVNYIESGDTEDGFADDNADFFGKLDRSVLAQREHFRRLKDDKVFWNLALYLGVMRGPEARRDLLWLARETTAKEQAVICLAWHRDPKDMPDLLPFMLEHSPAATSLPYHFRNSYGKAAIPYLERAVKDATSEFTRRAAEKELKILQKAQEDQRSRTKGPPPGF